MIESLLTVLGVGLFCGVMWFVISVALHTKKPRWATGATRSQASALPLSQKRTRS